MWVWSTCPWWNRKVQITEFVKQWIPTQLHSEADASKDGQIRPHIRPHIRPGPDMAGYENLAGFWPGPGPDLISGATLFKNNQTLVHNSTPTTINKTTTSIKPSPPLSPTHLQKWRCIGIFVDSYQWQGHVYMLEVMLNIAIVTSRVYCK